MAFVQNLENDEFRDGFLVTSDRKRLWNAEIELILEFQRVCEKHNLKFWATGGTLLGAVRHRGFIPWDDDTDLVMPRADYDRLKQIAPTEFRYPFYFDLWYEHPKTSLSVYGCWPVIPFIKIRNLTTSMIEHPHQKHIKQGIFIDIFPMDPFPPFDDSPEPEKVKQEYKMLKMLFELACRPKFLCENMKKDPNRKFLLPREEIERLLKEPLNVRGKMLEDHLSNFNHESKYFNIGWHRFPLEHTYIASERVWWNETIYLPFEKISVPVPKEFDLILKKRYGNYMEFPSKHVNHSVNYSTMISSEEYFASQR